MTRSIPLFFSLLVVTTGCRTADVSKNVDEGLVHEDAIDVDDDLDDNGIVDTEQSFVVGNDEDGNVLIIIDPAQKSPLGSSTGQHPMFWGYGSGEYSDDEGFTAFFPAVEAYSEQTGEFLGYGNSGLRCGAIYEMSVAEEGADIGELDLWWDLSKGVNAENDETDYLVEHLDGVANGCDRRSVHLALRTWGDCTVEPLGYSIAPEDPNCY